MDTACVYRYGTRENRLFHISPFASFDPIRGLVGESEEAPGLAGPGEGPREVISPLSLPKTFPPEPSHRDP